MKGKITYDIKEITEESKYLLTYSVDQSPSWEANRFSTSQEISPHIMESEGSLPQSQVPATCPYPEPAQSSPYPQSHFEEGN